MEAKKEMLVSQGSEFKLKFGGEQHQIDANSFINSLIHNISILEEINKSIDPNKRIEIKVKAPQKGSVVVEIGIQATSIIEGIKTLFSDETLSYTANLIEIFGGCYGIYHFLKGKKADVISKEGNNVTISNSNGNVITINQNIYTIYSNRPIIREAMSKNFEALSTDSSIDSFQVIDNKDDKIFNVSQLEFEELSYAEVENPELEKTDTVRATLRIIRLSFEGNLKSDFYYEGFKISAKIIHKKFIQRIDEGEKFAKGDHLLVDLEIVKRFDESVDTYINKAFTVITVHDHMPRGYQTKIE